MESFGELVLEARAKAKKNKSKEATVEAKDCTCSVTVSVLSEGSYFRFGEPIDPPDDRPDGGSTIERYDPCAEHEFRPRVLAARS